LLLDLDGGSVEADDARRLLGRGRTRGPQNGGSFVGAGAAGAHHTAALSVELAPSPEGAAGNDGGWAMLDGVLDNRRQLARLLGSAEPPSSDAGWVLEAYRRWGDDFASHLVGEFAAVVWDRRRRRLLAVRDPFGVRQLFYRRRGRRLEIASQTWQLADPGAGFDAIDPEFLADFLACQISVGDSTPFLGVRRLPAGHTLIADGGTVRISPHYRLPDDLDTGCRTAEDYAERFRDLFGEAVGHALETPGRVWSELSGGLDSSAIVSMVGHLRERGPDPAPGFGAITLAWPQTQISDETAWARLVAEPLGIEHRVLPCDDAFFDDAQDGALSRSEPHFGILCTPMHRRQAEVLEQGGVDVLLSGARAEGVVLDDFAPLHLADLLRTGRWLRLGRELKAWQRRSREPFLNLFYWSCLRPLLAPGTLDEDVEIRQRIPEWIEPAFASRLNLGDRLGPRQPRRYRSIAQQSQFERLQRSEQMLHRGHMELSVETRYPFLYRPLVEHCFATPWEIKHRPGWHKALVRDGLRGILPEQIVRRQQWASPTAAAFKSLRRCYPGLRRLADDLWLAKLGAVEPHAFRRALEQARHGACLSFVALTSTLACEYWLRAHVAPPASRAEAA
ncbi:MAG: asparagine synthase-related protein, partial [Acidobacteriota bacterium]